MNLTKIGWTVDFALRCGLWLQGLNLHFWWTVAEMAYWINIEGFIDALAVFVRESRNWLANNKVTNMSMVCKEPNPLWVADFLVALHLLLRCWWWKGSDSNDLELLTTELIRCSLAWQG